MTLRSSPTTSEIARHTVGPGAAAARRPPLTADRCLRIVLSAVISAPPLSSAFTAVRLSSSVRSPAGTAINADAPPDSSTTSVSPGSVRCATSSARRPAATLRSSGSGWLDGIHSSCAGSAIGRCVPMTMPSRMRSPAIAANVSAMNGAALPTAMTRRRLPSQARRDRRILHGAIDQMMRRRGFDGAARNGQKMLAKERQGRRLSERSSDRSSSTAPSRR